MEINNQIESLNQWSKGTLAEHLGIQFTKSEEGFLEGTMPVDSRTIQPFGILHGGASVALAETLGSVASNLMIDQSLYAVVGLDINSNHLRAVPKGKLVTGQARLIHAGKRTHVWEIKIFDEGNKLINISRLTMMVIDKPAS